MRIKNICVRKLFGNFDHFIPLQSPVGVTIIHGPNGFGKTAILKMTSSLIKGSTSIFENTPFFEFRLTFDDDTSLLARRNEVTGQTEDKPEVRVRYYTCDAQGSETEVSAPKLRTSLPLSVLRKIDKLIPPPYELRGDTWKDPAGQEFSVTEILELFPKAEEAVPLEFRPKTLVSALENLPVFLVETNRLGAQSEPEDQDASSPSGMSTAFSVSRGIQSMFELHRNIPRQSTRVTQYSNDIVKKIKSVLGDYANRSQDLDRIFPERLVQFFKERKQALSDKEIVSRMKELDEKSRRLISLGLLDKGSVLRDLSEEEVRSAPEALTIYLDDVQEKLKAFEDMADRIGRLIDIINERFKYKKLRIDRELGFQAISDQGQTIQLEELSSGEQHELVVLYELLFRSPQNCLLLIDEPEISLHVAWQSRFLSDLIGILELTKAYVIVATHSPAIIDERWDLTVELKRPATVDIH